MNIGRRPHQFVTLAERNQLLRAANFARELRRPLDLTITVHWALAGGPGGGGGTWRDRQHKLLELLRHWLARRGMPAVWIWTAEQSAGGKDAHTHLAIHYPASTIKALETWLRDHLGGDDPHVLRLDLCSRHDGREFGWVKYCCKALSPEDHRKAGTSKKWREPQGTVYGKRTGWSRSIGRPAQNRYWRSRHVVGDAPVIASAA